MPEYQQVNRHIECDARTYASLVPNQMRYQTALHPDAQQHLEILTGFPSRRRSPPALSRNGIAPNGMDGNRNFPEKFPCRSRAAMVSSRRMLSAIICAAFGFLCLPVLRRQALRLDSRATQSLPHGLRNEGLQHEDDGMTAPPPSTRSE